MQSVVTGKLYAGCHQITGLGKTQVNDLIAERKQVGCRRISLWTKHPPLGPVDVRALTYGHLRDQLIQSQKRQSL